MKKLNYLFEKVECETSAYLLGFIFADGCILGSPHNRLQIALAHKDEDLLYKFNKFLSDECLITKNPKDVRLVIAKKELVDNLKKLGVIQNKTGTKMIIPEMPKELVRHFIRGFFDGDGYTVKDRQYVYAGICGADFYILEEFSKIFRENKISCSLIRDNTKQPGDKIDILGNICTINFHKWNVYIKKRNSLETLYDYFYKHSTIFLDRKRDVIKNFLDIKSKRISRNTDFIEFNGKVQSIDKWADELNISKHTLKWRLFKANWTIEQALSNDTSSVIIRQNYKNGENHHNAKLTNEQVLEIFQNPESSRIIAEQYNIDRTTVDKIRNGVNYSKITEHLPKTKLLNNNTIFKHRK